MKASELSRKKFLLIGRNLLQSQALRPKLPSLIHAREWQSSSPSSWPRIASFFPADRAHNQESLAFQHNDEVSLDNLTLWISFLSEPLALNLCRLRKQLPFYPDLSGSKVPTPHTLDRASTGRPRGAGWRD